MRGTLSPNSSPLAIILDISQNVPRDNEYAGEGWLFGGMSHPKTSNKPNLSEVGLRRGPEARRLHFAKNILEWVTFQNSNDSLNGPQMILAQTCSIAAPQDHLPARFNPVCLRCGRRQYGAVDVCLYNQLLCCTRSPFTALDL